MDFAKDLAKVQALQPGQSCTVFWFAESGGDVERVGDLLILREVAFGGEYISEDTFALTQAADLVEMAYTWT